MTDDGRMSAPGGAGADAHAGVGPDEELAAGEAPALQDGVHGYALARALAAVLRAVAGEHPVKPHPVNASWLPVCGGCSTGQTSHYDDGSYTHTVLASKCPTRLAVLAALAPLAPLFPEADDGS